MTKISEMLHTLLNRLTLGERVASAHVDEIVTGIVEHTKADLIPVIEAEVARLVAGVKDEIMQMINDNAKAAAEVADKVVTKTAAKVAATKAATAAPVETSAAAAPAKVDPGKTAAS